MATLSPEIARSELLPPIIAGISPKIDAKTPHFWCYTSKLIHSPTATNGAKRLASPLVLNSPQLAHVLPLDTPYLRCYK